MSEPVLQALMTLICSFFVPFFFVLICQSSTSSSSFSPCLACQSEVEAERDAYIRRSDPSEWLPKGNATNKSDDGTAEVLRRANDLSPRLQLRDCGSSP